MVQVDDMMEPSGWVTPDGCGAHRGGRKDGGIDGTKEHNVLDAAKAILDGGRQTHGEPEDCFDIIALFWSTYLGEKIDSIDVAHMMILLKVARAQSGNHKKNRDNYVDIAGYAAIAGDWLPGRTK